MDIFYIGAVFCLMNQIVQTAKELVWYRNSGDKSPATNIMEKDDIERMLPNVFNANSGKNQTDPKISTCLQTNDECYCKFPNLLSGAWIRQQNINKLMSSTIQHISLPCFKQVDIKLLFCIHVSPVRLLWKRQLPSDAFYDLYQFCQTGCITELLISIAVI